METISESISIEIDLFYLLLTKNGADLIDWFNFLI